MRAKYPETSKYVLCVRCTRGSVILSEAQYTARCAAHEASAAECARQRPSERAHAGRTIVWTFKLPIFYFLRSCSVLFAAPIWAVDLGQASQSRKRYRYQSEDLCSSRHKLGCNRHLYHLYRGQACDSRQPPRSTAYVGQCTSQFTISEGTDKRRFKLLTHMRLTC